jgi:phage gp46-like protein
MAKIENWADIRELVLMSVGTDKGSWWADPEFGSELWLLKQSGNTAGETALAARRMILEATAWLVSDGLVKKIECEAERSGRSAVSYTVTIYRPGGGSDEIKEVWNAV